MQEAGDLRERFLIEPKADGTDQAINMILDAATVIGFLREFDLMDDDFKLNLEVNHATLAHHTFQHELQVAANAGVMGQHGCKPAATIRTDGTPISFPIIFMKSRNPCWLSSKQAASKMAA